MRHWTSRRRAACHSSTLIASKSRLRSVSCADAEGCAADGATYREALENVEVVIREWIEVARDLGRPVPEPRGRLMYA